MTRRSPRDAAFNKMVREEIEGTSRNERVLFIDHQNQVREAVYPREFSTGVLQAVRKRLEDLGELKAVVHISAVVFGASDGHGPRTSLVEYLPDKQYYATAYSPNFMNWMPEDDEQSQAAIAKTTQLFATDEGSS